VNRGEFPDLPAEGRHDESADGQADAGEYRQVADHAWERLHRVENDEAADQCGRSDDQPQPVGGTAVGLDVSMFGHDVL